MSSTPRYLRLHSSSRGGREIADFRDLRSGSGGEGEQQNADGAEQMLHHFECPEVAAMSVNRTAQFRALARLSCHGGWCSFRAMTGCCSRRAQGRGSGRNRARLLLGCVALILAACASFAAGAAASGSTRYVSSSGSDTDNDCLTASNPCLMVQYAVDQADSGDTVAVAGVHKETVRIRESLTITQ